jgi:NAD-dependent protein deacetylases, SIR2 family
MTDKTLTENVAELQKFIDTSKNIVFFGGAGVSTESGIPDFRSVDGLYNQKWQYPPEQILSRSFFDSHPAEFFRFYREKFLIRGIKPNAAHFKLAELEQAGKLSAVVTQNVDGLHQAAGSRTVFELHGSIVRNFCMNCHASYDTDFIMASAGTPDGIPHCTKCNGIVKPDIVLYEEKLDECCMEGAVAAIRNADMLIIGGTSLSVYPAAGLIDYYSGNKLILINKSATSNELAARLSVHDSIGKVLGAIKIN